jgi:hypothetical protein
VQLYDQQPADPGTGHSAPPCARGRAPIYVILASVAPQKPPCGSLKRLVFEEKGLTRPACPSDLRRPTGYEQNMVIIEPLMSRLAVRRPIFHSEADFQHELAIELRAMDPDLQLRLEYPFGHGARARLDVLLLKGDARFGLELKYLCRSTDVIVGGERFQLRHQSAHDIRRYDVCKDIVRIEDFCQRLGAAGGVLILTNDPAYWSSRRRSDTFDAAFDLADLRILSGELAWAESAGAGTTKGRETPLAIAGRYPLQWCDYADNGCTGGHLRYLYIPIESAEATIKNPAYV